MSLEKNFSLLVFKKEKKRKEKAFELTEAKTFIRARK